MKPGTGRPLLDAIDVLLHPDALTEIALHARGVHTVEEIAPKLEAEAVRSDRASEAFAQRERYDLAAGERERAALLRRYAAAINASRSGLLDLLDEMRGAPHRDR